MTELSPVQLRVVGAYRSGACLRRPIERRKELDGPRYRKGWEVRFYVGTQDEAALLAEALADAGLQAGRPYRKRPTRWIVPVYGRREVDLLLEWAALGQPTGDEGVIGSARST
jgi:hypothetical protein